MFFFVLSVVSMLGQSIRFGECGETTTVFTGVAMAPSGGGPSIPVVLHFFVDYGISIICLRDRTPPLHVVLDYCRYPGIL